MKKITVILSSLLFVLMLCVTGMSLTQDYQYQIPEKMNDGWEVSSLEAEGIKPDLILDISAQIRDIDRIDEVLSMLIVKNGKLVHEVYSPYVQRNTLVE